MALAAARAEGEGRAAELEAELAVLQAPPRRPSPAPALDPAPLEWAEQNQRLAEELQEVGTWTPGLGGRARSLDAWVPTHPTPPRPPQALERERGLRAELASLREETRAQGRSQAELEAAAQSLSAEVRPPNPGTCVPCGKRGAGGAGPGHLGSLGFPCRPPPQIAALRARVGALEQEARELRAEAEAAQGQAEAAHGHGLVLRRELHEKELEVPAGGPRGSWQGHPGAPIP